MNRLVNWYKGGFHTAFVGCEFLASRTARLVGQGVRKFPYEPHQVLDLVHVPRLEDGADNLFARDVDTVGHRPAFRGDDGLAHAAVGGACPTLRETQAFELRHLTAAGGVVAPDPVGQLDPGLRPPQAFRGLTSVNVPRPPAG